MDYTVTQLQQKIRLIDYCKQELNVVFLSKNAIVKSIKNGEILLNGQSTSTGAWLKEGDNIKYKQKLDPKYQKVFPLQISVVFEDEHLAIINKPAGYDVSGNKFQTIQNALLHNLKISTEEDFLSIPRPVHRLDNQTTGILLVAKTQSAVIHLSKQFENREVSKTYVLICFGTIENDLIINTAIDELEAETSFIPQQLLLHKNLGQMTLVYAFPKTGRKHQIRKHMSSINASILGDRLYGTYYQKGLFLCALGIEFSHPKSGQKLKFDLDLPNKFKTIIKHSGTGQEK